MGFDKTTDSTSDTAEGHHKRWLRWPTKKKEKHSDAGSTGTESSSTLALHDPEKAEEEDDGKSLWDRAYEALRNEDSKLVLKYEKLLSTELSQIESKAPDSLAEADSYEIDNVINNANLAQRRNQLDKIVKNGAAKFNSTDHYLREAADKTAELVLWAKDIIDQAVKASPEASMAWAGICIVLPLLTNPSVAEHANREGFAYVTSRMKYYVAFEPLLLRTSAVVPRDLMTEYKELIADLYKHILEFQLRSVLRLYSDWYKNFARDIIRPGLWDELKKAITSRETLLSNGLMQINTVVSTNTQQDHLSEAHQSKELLSQLVDNLRDHSQEEQQADEAKCRQLFLLLTGQHDESYEWYKDRIEDRVAGTCNWFLQHENFQSWLEQDSGLIIVSADPGCGKSVLSKYLIDSQLPRSSTICYFFFKDQDQNTIRQALCALLHQLLSQKPGLIRHAMPEYKRYGEKLVHLTSSLWRILENASKDPEARSIIFVLDALDECKEVDFKDLASHLMALFPSDRQESNKVKFLLTTRPYQEVLSEFRVLVNASPHIRIPGEDDSETIAQEVNEVIKYRVNQLAVEKELSNDIRDHLELKLLNITHRTYLWVYLVFDYLKSKDFKRTKKGIEAAISSLPESVAEAYDRILSRSKDNKMVLKALSIILAARRPLTLSEMNIAINVDSSCISTEDLDLESNKDFKERLRSWCGLFISIYDKSVYFLHQTAREFLLSSLSMPQSLSSAPAPLHWQGSISVEHAESVLAEICITYLMLLNSPDVPLTEDNVIETENINNYGFMMYSAKYWTSHLQEAGISDEALLSSIFEICDPSSKSYAMWHTMDIFNYFLYERNLTTLMVLANFKNEVLVKRLLETKESNAELKERIGINTKTEPSEWTALTWAAAKGNADIVKLLLEDGEVDINLEGNSGLTPLEFAGENGYLAVAEHLLLHADKFEVNLKDENGPSELFIAIRYGDGDEIEAIVRAIIENGQGDINSRNLAGRTPLALAAMYGKESIVRTFLNTGKVDVDSRDENGQTALALAAIGGYEGVCQMLLDTGKVDVDSRDVEDRTPLALAAEFGHEAFVDILLRTAKVDVNSKSVTGVSPLSRATANGHSAVVTLLINTGKVDIDSKDAEGATALPMASANGHEEVMKLLLSAGKSSSIERSESTQDPNDELSKQEHDENDNTVNTALSGTAGIHDAESTETTPLQAEIDG